MYTLTGLEEGTEYSVAVTATLTGGGTEQDAITATTMAAGECLTVYLVPARSSINDSLSAPSAPPSSVRVSVESSTAISVQWGPVEPCADRNGPITGYSVRYGVMGSGRTQNKTVSGDSRMTTISELTNETVHKVEVAAETRAGTGVYSLPLTIQTPDSECVLADFSVVTSHVRSDVYLSLNGTIIPNHGHVDINDIGSTSDFALLCHTNRPPYPGGVTSGGDWFAPDGTRVDGTDVPGFTRNRGPTVVRLISTSGSPPEGIYKCAIQDVASIFPRWIYVGLYNRGQGSVQYLCNEVEI